MKIPKTCPSCGAGDEHFVADYLEAVHQGIDIEDDREGYDYNGIYGSYDDGSTEDECIRCQSCSVEVMEFGHHELVLAGFWTIFGVYEDNDQRYADFVEAKTSIEAAEQAPEGLRIVAIVPGKVTPDLEWERPT